MLYELIDDVRRRVFAVAETFVLTGTVDVVVVRHRHGHHAEGDVAGEFHRHRRAVRVVQGYAVGRIGPPGDEQVLVVQAVFTGDEDIVGEVDRDLNRGGVCTRRRGKGDQRLATLFDAQTFAQGEGVAGSVHP